MIPVEITWGLVLPWVNVGVCPVRGLWAFFMTPQCSPCLSTMGKASGASWSPRKGSGTPVFRGHLHQWGQALCGEHSLGQSLVLWIPLERKMQNHLPRQLPTPVPCPASHVQAYEWAQPPAQGGPAEESSSRCWLRRSISWIRLVSACLQHCPASEDLYPWSRGSLWLFCPWCFLLSLFFCLKGFGLDKTFMNVHNTSASAQMHERILSFHNIFCMIWPDWYKVN